MVTKKKGFLIFKGKMNKKKRTKKKKKGKNTYLETKDGTKKHKIMNQKPNGKIKYRRLKMTLEKNIG